MEAQNHLVMWLRPGFFPATPHTRPYPCGVICVWALLRVYLGVDPCLRLARCMAGCARKGGSLIQHPSGLLRGTGLPD